MLDIGGFIKKYYMIKTEEIKLKNLLQTLEGKLTMVTEIIINNDFEGSYFWCYGYNEDEFKPIHISSNWLLNFGYEDWGTVIENEYEKYQRFVLHNFVDGTSNHEVHIIESNYGNQKHIEYATSIDKDERQYNGRMEFVHDLQNAVYKETGKDLVLSDNPSL